MSDVYHGGVWSNHWNHDYSRIQYLCGVNIQTFGSNQIGPS